jgi:hypothetical protein
MNRSTRKIVSIAAGSVAAIGVIPLWITLNGGWNNISDTLKTLLMVPIAGLIVIGIALVATQILAAAFGLGTYALLGLFGSSTEEKALRTTEEVVKFALEQFRNGSRVRATCLRCNGRVLATLVPPKYGGKADIRLSCRCGECSGIYPLYATSV